MSSSFSEQTYLEALALSPLAASVSWKLVERAKLPVRWPQSDDMVQSITFTPRLHPIQNSTNPMLLTPQVDYRQWGATFERIILDRLLETEVIQFKRNLPHPEKLPVLKEMYSQLTPPFRFNAAWVVNPYVLAIQIDGLYDKWGAITYDEHYNITGLFGHPIEKLSWPDPVIILGDLEHAVTAVIITDECTPEAFMMDVQIIRPDAVFVMKGQPVP